MAEVLHHDNHGHDGHHEHDDTDLTVFGFWTYLMSDLILSDHSSLRSLY